MCEPGTIIAAPISFFTVPKCNNGDCSENLPSVHWYLRFFRVCHLPALSSQLPAIRSRVGHLKANLYPLTLLLALYESLIASTSRTSRPTLPRLSVGGGRTIPVPVYPRGSPRLVRFHKSPGPPSTHSRVAPARASSATSPLVAVHDRFKGLVLSYTLLFCYRCTCFLFLGVMSAYPQYPQVSAQGRTGRDRQ